MVSAVTIVPAPHFWLVLMMSIVRPFKDGRFSSWCIRANQTIPQFESDVLIYRAGMRFLLLHTQFGEHFDDHAGFDLKLPSQLVDSDLLHRWNCYVTP